MTRLNQKNKKVIIIGNGFDLNLGLATSYRDFTRSMEFLRLSRQNSFFSYIKNKEKINNWVDVEVELKNYSKEKEDFYFRGDYLSLCGALCKYLNGLSYGVINKESAAYKLFESLKNQDYFIFDFNYTQTLEHIAMLLDYNSFDLSNRVIKVHGNAKDNSIIFGVEDAAIIKDDDVFLQKAFPLFIKELV